MTIASILDQMINVDTTTRDAAITQATTMLADRSDATDYAIALLAKNFIIQKRNPDQKIVLLDADVQAALGDPEKLLVTDFSSPGVTFSTSSSATWYNPGV